MNSVRSFKRSLMRWGERSAWWTTLTSAPKMDINDTGHSPGSPQT